ncbi:MAG TPA: hypothetical protein VIN40_11355 [Candidatus Tyrphobacter sp.]
MSSGRARALGVLAFSLAVLPTKALAADIAVGPSVIVNAQLVSGSLTIRVWNLSQVRIVTDGRIGWRHLGAAQIQPRIPTQIDFWAQTTPTPRGDITLPAESFTLPPLPGLHDAIVARGYGQTTITVPEGTALIVGRISSSGSVFVSDYRGTLVATTNAGTIDVQSFAGTAYLQALRGRIFVGDSTFDRVRARSGVGPVIFSSCRASQIDASAVVGAVIYDDGMLGQGPVHFAAEFGDIAVGVAGAPTAVRHMTTGDTTVTFGAGRIVTATSAHGSIFTYSGKLSEHPEFLARWPRGGVLLRARGPGFTGYRQRRPPFRYR